MEKQGRRALALTGLLLLGTARAQEVQDALDDSEALYCAQVYSQAEQEFAGAGDADLALMAAEARRRALPLMQRDNDLLNDDPSRHKRASAEAEARLAKLPPAPGTAHGIALRAAYEHCLAEEDAAPGAAAARIALTGNRRFCRELLLRAATVSPRLRKSIGGSERNALDEMQRIAQALAQPLPGQPLSPDQDREASQQAAARRLALAQAMAGWQGQADPSVQELNRCYDDYAEGRLGGPNVLAAAAPPAEAPPVAPDRATPPSPGIDLGPVFHLREIAPGGNYEGLWRRQGDSNFYDGVWVHLPDGQLQQDVLEVAGVTNGELVIRRRRAGGSYRARLLTDGRLAPGTASWAASPAYTWQPLPAQRTGGSDLGPVAHMRELTPAGNFEGIWRRRGQTHVYDALWVYLPSGEVMEEVLSVTLRQGRIEAHRLDIPGLYDGRVPKRPLPARTAGRVSRQWQLLPAQKITVLPAATASGAATLEPLPATASAL